MSRSRRLRTVILFLVGTAAIGLPIWYLPVAVDQLAAIHRLKSQKAVVTTTWWGECKLGKWTFPVLLRYPGVKVCLRDAAADLRTASRLRRLTSLALFSCTIEEQQLPSLRELESLETLLLEEVGVDPRVLGYLSPHCPLYDLRVSDIPLDVESLSHLWQFPSLKVICLRNVGLDDRGLELLSRLEQLRRLHIRYCPITGAGVQHLARMRSLYDLDLGGCALDDAALDVLPSLRGLVTLSLWENAITDEGCWKIANAKMEELRRLDLSDTWITDEGLKALAQLPKLKSLILSGTRITDKGLEALETMDLDWIMLDSTNVTSAGVHRLRQCMPHAGIEWDKPQQFPANEGDRPQ